ncbi:endonuclease domain-containing protein [Micromonospora sp. NPDC126480]|uniref:endonuclease domain-containing protein n=1 Tax=Micromonospora sp. NPDC126480 TaxID=3155312 RepID=UPI00332A1F8B
MALVDARLLGLVAPHRTFDVCCLDNPKKALQRHRITAVRYRELLRAQGGGCGVCGTSAWRHPVGLVPLPVDHDHLCCSGRDSCGRCVRGLLCAGCNGFLGLVEIHGNAMLRPRTWIESARAYLTYAGVDPWEMDRFVAKGRIHRDRRIRAGIDCGCYHCTGDPKGAGGWIAAAIAAGEPVWDEIIRRTARQNAKARALGLTFADDDL